MSTKEHGQFEANYNLQIDPKALLSAKLFFYLLLRWKKPILHFPVGGTLLAPTTKLLEKLLDYTQRICNLATSTKTEDCNIPSKILMMH